MNKSHNFGYVSRTRLEGVRVGGLVVTRRHHSLRNFWLARCRCGKMVAKADAELADAGREHYCADCHKRNRDMARARLKQKRPRNNGVALALDAGGK